MKLLYNVISVRVYGGGTIVILPSFFEVGMVRPVGTGASQTIDLDSRGWEIYLVSDDSQQLARDGRRARELLRYE